MGERFEAFNQLGIKTVLWNQDSWSEDGTSYKNIPILHSSVGYMLFFNSAYSAVADIGVTDKRKYSLDFNGPKFDMYFWTGSPLENIASYTSNPTVRKMFWVSLPSLCPDIKSSE